MKNRYLILSLAVLSICLFLPQKSQGQSTISCNSDDMGRHSCSVDTRGGVHMTRQHSDAACTEGYSWGTDDRGIWVDHGCRADFTVGDNRNFPDANGTYRDGNRDNRNDDRNRQYNRNAQSIACNSDDEQRHSCPVDTRGGVRLRTQRSDAACTEGYSWGSDDQGVWVDHGCRADFSVGGSAVFQDRSNANRDNRDVNRDGRVDDQERRDYRDRNYQTITCNSGDMRRHSCRVETRYSDVRMVTQHSEAACTRGYSWGTSKHGIWVDHGCRADFEVITRDHQNSWR
ncbi:MAG: hypothetical protein NVS9B14_01180 [Candidatus Acidiferrum sp.]